MIISNHAAKTLLSGLFIDCNVSNFQGADEGNQHAWADSGEESDGEENVYTRYQGKSPGNILSDKFGKINETLGIKKYKKFGENDIMEMSSGSRTGV